MEYSPAGPIKAGFFFAIQKLSPHYMPCRYPRQGFFMPKMLNVCN
nr:MAG TPA: hypothetical protein [Caudoviricetes sp.]